MDKLSVSSPDLPLPPKELRFMGEDDDQRLVEVGSRLAGVLRSHGLPDDGHLVDVGSGYGRLALGLLATDYRGSYLGFDILRRHVRWCRQNLMPLTDQRFRFRHLDVRNGRYNPKGTVSSHEVTFPAANDSADMVCLFSIFTHLYEADIRRYLSEIRRVLKPGATALITWFLFDEERIPRAISETQSTYPMVNMINATCRFSDASDPLRAISYDRRFVESMIRSAGLQVASVELGSWCGDPSPELQDVIVVRKPVARGRALARRVVNRLRRLSARR
jgi:SAM-dependent methyltransferase